MKINKGILIHTILAIIIIYIAYIFLDSIRFDFFACVIFIAETIVAVFITHLICRDNYFYKQTIKLW